MSDSYLKALEDARKELEGLIQERAELDRRIARLATSIEGLAALCDQTTIPDELKAKLVGLEMSETMGLTEAIRQIISSSIFPISTTSIRDALVEEGFDPNKYSNMLAVIHNTLLRLERQGEIHRGIAIFGRGRGWVMTSKATSGKVPHVPKSPPPAQMTPPPDIKKSK